MKKASHEPLADGDFDHDSDIASTASIPILNHGSMSNDDLPNSIAMKHDDATDFSSVILSDETKSLVFSFTQICIMRLQIWIPNHF